MIRIITLSCPECGTIVAGNVLESHRVMKCPGIDCQNVLTFEDLDENEMRTILDNPSQYRMSDQ